MAIALFFPYFLLCIDLMAQDILKRIELQTDNGQMRQRPTPSIAIWVELDILIARIKIIPNHTVIKDANGHLWTVSNFIAVPI